jgi:hypothetical protein
MPTTSTFPDQAGQPMLCHDCWYVSLPVVLLIIPPSYYFVEKIKMHTIVHFAGHIQLIQ